MMTDITQFQEQVFAGLSILVAIIATLVAVVRLIRLEYSRKYQEEHVLHHAAIVDDIKRSSDHTKPFETEALANYYNQVLARANVSFWFSIVFASIGFGVIVFAFASHTPDDVTGTVIKVSSGVIIDAVSSLFFVQSTGAQRSMADFFEKLRLDRLNAEARDMIGEIEDGERRDQLRAQLILKYSGIEKLLIGTDAARGQIS